MANLRDLELAVLDEANKKLSAFTVGFVFIDIVDKKERPRCAGSGTLVQIGAVRGILTAAHVTCLFDRQDEIGLVLYEPQLKRRRQSFRFQSSLAQIISIGPGRSFHGPDLSFVRMPPDVAGSIQAHASFFNLSKRRDAVLSGKIKNGRKYFDCVAGTVAQHSGGIVFNGVMQTGSTTALTPRHGMDLLSLRPDRGPNDRPITTYQGVSGGGFWRIYVTEQTNGVYQFGEACLFGVAFREGELKQGKRAIKCHGPDSVYRVLLDKMTTSF